MQKWEYMELREYNSIVAQINNEQVSKGLLFTKGKKVYVALNELGQEGWELVGMGQDRMGGLNYVLKRPITS
jgi:hypothetical protein